MKKWISPFSAVALAAAFLVLPMSHHAHAMKPSSIDWREEYAYTLGSQAYIFAYPWLYMAELRHGWVGTKPAGFNGIDMPFNHWHHIRNLVTAAYRDGGSPNNDTLYSVTFLDLNKEPVILSHADMGDRYFTFEIASMTSDNFAYIGTRTTGGEAGHFLLAGPDWKGKLPEGVKMPAQANGTKMMGLPATSPTPYVLIFGRTAVQGKKDVKAVNELQDQYKLTPLSLWGKKDAKVTENRDVWKTYDVKSDPLADWKTINRMMAENPPLEQNKLVLNMFKDIGIGAGLDVEKMPDGIKRGLARAAKEGRESIGVIGAGGAFGKVINGWSFPPKTMGSAGYYGDFLTRGAVQSKAGIIANDPEEASYPNTRVDANGDPLDGAHKYTMTFAKGGLPKVSQFWSLTLYDNTFNFVDNPIDRYNISSLSGGYKKADDGSLTLYVQADSPGKDKEANWLPSPKSGSFFMVFRTYGPNEEIVQQAWQIPGLIKVK